MAGQTDSEVAMRVFPDDALTNMLVFLVAEAEANVIDEDDVGLMWLIACELHRRRCRKVVGFLAATPAEIIEDEALNMWKN